MKFHFSMKDLKRNIWAKLNAAFTLSNRLDQLSAQLAAQQLDERLYGQTVYSNGWNGLLLD